MRPMTQPRPFLRAIAPVLAASAAVMLVLSACTPDLNQVSPTATPTVAPTTGGFDAYAQKLDWAACAELECATLVARLLLRREHDDRHVADLWVSAEVAHQGEAIGARHDQILEDDTRPHFTCEGQCTCHIGAVNQLQIRLIR